MPLIAQLVLCSVSPAGNDGEEEHAVGVMPLRVGAYVLIATVSTNTYGLPE